jgi:hypothetical protein
MAVPAPALLGQQTTGHQPVQMARRSGRRDTGEAGHLGGRPGPAVEQGETDRGTRAIGQQRPQ